jgi:aspartate/methionine/tyrosine aminotransferase
VQLAGVAALEGPDEPVQAMVHEFRRRRDYIVAGLNSLPGVTCKTPEGAFYVFPNVSQITLEDRKLASYLLEEAGVAALGGTAFGEAGRGYMRFSYAASLETIGAALDRLRQALPNFKG